MTKLWSEHTYIIQAHGHCNQLWFEYIYIISKCTANKKVYSGILRAHMHACTHARTHAQAHIHVHMHTQLGEVALGLYADLKRWVLKSCLKADSWNLSLSVSTQSSEWPQFCIVPWLHAGHAAFAISVPTTWCADFADGRAEKVWLHRHVSLVPWSSYTGSHHGNCRKQTYNPRQKTDMQPKTKCRQNRMCVQFVCLLMFLS